MIVAMLTPTDRKVARQMMLDMARAQGCRCKPDINVPKMEAGELYSIPIMHDDWCPLLQQVEAMRSHN